MIRELRAWNASRVGEGKLPVDIGIGLNTDNVVSGNIGSKKRMDYTIIGSQVNLAARLCDEAKGGQILLSQRVYAAVEELVEAEPVGDLTLKGLHRPVAVYNVLRFKA